MPDTVQLIPTNEFLRRLAPGTRAMIDPHLSRVTLVMAQVLHEVGTPVDDVFFVVEGLVSLTADTRDQGQVEIGMIGREGFAGMSALLAPGCAAFHRAFVQVPGSALRMRAVQLRALFDEDTDFRNHCLRYQNLLMATSGQSAACNARHELPRRLARWLLMTRDRIDSDELPMTQEFLAVMLGVRRAGVSVVAGVLQDKGLISQTRGRVRLLDRPGLEAEACDCYGQVEIWRKECMTTSKWQQ